MPVAGSVTVRMLVLPREALEGLSRSITPAGSEPPVILSESISVSKKRVGPISVLLWTSTTAWAGADPGEKVSPPFKETWKST